jgi:hypothetical protein
MGIYNEIDQLNAQVLFRYIIVLLFNIYFFSKINIKLNALMALIIGSFIVIYLNDRRKSTIGELEEQHQAKVNVIKPDPIKFKDKEDVVDFIFSIQDLYAYNPQAYEEMIDNINSFFTLYEIIQIGVINCEEFFALAENKKQNAMNSLHSITFSLPTSKKLTDKLNNSHKKLDEVLKVYLNDIYNICRRELYREGYDITRKLIDTGPRASNHYLNMIAGATYDIY